MGVLPDKWNDYFDKPLWSNRIAYYGLIFVVLFSIFIGIYSVITTLHAISDMLSFIFHIQNPIFNQYNATELSTNGFYDNERYLLSALVQSLAAVIALVITLSLVAVQLTAQSHSPRVIDVYKKNPDMWILLFIYIITIFYGLGLIKFVGLGTSVIFMEGAIFGAYFMSFFAFVCLVPYMLKTLDLLKPSTVIKLLAEYIAKENILKFLKDDDDINEKDPVQPIIDMVNASIEKNDYETVINGLKAIRISTSNLLNDLKDSETKESEVSHHIMSRLEFTGIHAINISNEEMAKLIVDTLEKIGNETINLELNKAEDKVAVALQNIGRKSAERELKLTTLRTLSALYNLGENKLNQNNGNIETMIFECIEHLGLYTADLNQRHGLGGSIHKLKTLLIKANNQQNENIASIIQNSLDTLARKSKEKKWSFIPTSN